MYLICFGRIWRKLYSRLSQSRHSVVPISRLTRGALLDYPRRWRGKWRRSRCALLQCPNASKMLGDSPDGFDVIRFAYCQAMSCQIFIRLFRLPGASTCRSRQRSLRPSSYRTPPCKQIGPCLGKNKLARLRRRHGLGGIPFAEFIPNDLHFILSSSVTVAAKQTIRLWKFQLGAKHNLFKARRVEQRHHPRYDGRLALTRRLFIRAPRDATSLQSGLLFAARATSDESSRETSISRARWLPRELPRPPIVRLARRKVSVSRAELATRSR